MTAAEAISSAGTPAERMNARLPGVEDSDRAAELVAAAHQVCPYSNATRGNIEVALSANGRTVE